MPFVNVKLVGTLSREQKEEIAAQISTTLETVANKSKSHTYIVFDEVPAENWAIGDKLLDKG